MTWSYLVLPVVLPGTTRGPTWPYPWPYWGPAKTPWLALPSFMALPGPTVLQEEREYRRSIRVEFRRG